MTTDIKLNNLEKKSNSLKSRLLHEQLRYDNYSFTYFHKYSKLILDEYKQHKSLFKSSSNLGIDYENVLEWYFQGQLGNSVFADFYNDINRINQFEVHVKDEKDIKTATPEERIDGEYEISQYGDGWSYKTFIDGEKVFLISGNLDKLKDKVKSKRLPLD